MPSPGTPLSVENEAMVGAAGGCCGCDNTFGEPLELPAASVATKVTFIGVTPDFMNVHEPLALATAVPTKAPLALSKIETVLFASEVPTKYRKVPLANFAVRTGVAGAM